jgi:hypothetical protein
MAIAAMMASVAASNAAIAASTRKYDGSYPYPTNDELGISPVLRTTLGQPVLEEMPYEEMPESVERSDMIGIPKAEGIFEKFIKSWFPNVKYGKGRHRKWGKKCED